ncbi:MAG: hypothetical protein RhofKO_25100 [Rhodothermales bacterium]
MFNSAFSLLATFARSDDAMLAHAQLTPQYLTVRLLTWSGLRTEQIDLTTLTGVEYFCESPRETGLTLHVQDGTVLTLHLKAARLWLLTLTDAAPHLEHQGVSDTLPLERVTPVELRTNLIEETPEIEPEPVLIEEPTPEVESLVIAAPHDCPLNVDMPDEPYRVRSEFNLADGWNADRMTRALNQISASETDRRSQALLRVLEWADA